MTQYEPTPRYRSSALDRALAGARIVAVVGPVADLDEGNIRANLAAAEGATTHPRMSLIPRSDSRFWEYQSGFSQSVVTRRDDLATDDLGRLVSTVRNRTETRCPLEVLICGDYLVVDYSHGLGDGQLGLLLLAVLAGDRDILRARTLAVGLPEDASRAAVLRHYRADLKALRHTWGLRKANKVTEDGLDGRRIEHWQLAKTSRSALMEPQQVKELRQWAKDNAPGATTAGVTIALWLAALGSVGVPLHQRVMILMNCRRYLGTDYTMAQGNFAVGIPIRMPTPPAPEKISALMREVIESGWPVAVLQMAEMKAAWRLGGSHDDSETAEVPDRVRLSVSDLGRLNIFDHVHWRPGRAPQVAAFLEPDGADAVSMLVTELAGTRTFTASFCNQMIDPSRIEDAMAQMCAEPVATMLTRH